VRLAALNLMEISRIDLCGLGTESVISENLRFSLKIHVFSLSPNVTFYA